MGTPGTVVGGRYVIEGLLGQGGQAVVYRVRDRDGTVRALKQLLPACAGKKRLRARFENEARILSTLRHPNLVQVSDVGGQDGLPWFVMEFVAGGSLADRITRDGPLPPDRATQALLQVCAGLEAAHAAGVIHRDVKPHNVLLGENDTCKLMDFGIAHDELAGLRTRAGASLGTEGFMAPEQAADAASVDGRADVYGVGMTGYVLVTGRDPLQFVQGRVDGVPRALLPLLTQATEDRADDRFASVAAFAEALRAVQAGAPTDPVRVSPPSAPPPAALPTSFLETPPGAPRSLTSLSIGGRQSDEDHRPRPAYRWLVGGVVSLVVVVVVLAVAVALGLRG
jgi:serine/threonine-protein kinase